MLKPKHMCLNSCSHTTDSHGVYNSSLLIHIYMYTCLHSNTPHTRTYMHIYIYIYMCVCASECICIYIYMYVYNHILYIYCLQSCIIISVFLICPLYNTSETQITLALLYRSAKMGFQLSTIQNRNHLISKPMMPLWCLCICMCKS